MPVPVFCCFCIPEKLVWKYSRNWTKLGQNFLFFQHEHGVQRRDGGGPRGTHTMGPRGPPCRVVGWCGAHVALQPPPFRLLIPPRCENPKYLSKYPRKVPETPPSSTLAREGSEALPGTLPERGIIIGGLYITMPASGVMRE